MESFLRCSSSWRSPASASAWTAYKVGESMVVYANPGEVNTLTVDISSGAVTDTSAPFTPMQGDCFVIIPNGVQCLSFISHASIIAKDGDDTLTVSGSGNGPVRRT